MSSKLNRPAHIFICLDLFRILPPIWGTVVVGNYFGWGTESSGLGNPPFPSTGLCSLLGAALGEPEQSPPPQLSLLSAVLEVHTSFTANFLLCLDLEGGAGMGRYFILMWISTVTIWKYRHTGNIIYVFCAPISEVHSRSLAGYRTDYLIKQNFRMSTEWTEWHPSNFVHDPLQFVEQQPTTMFSLWELLECWEHWVGATTKRLPWGLVPITKCWALPCHVTSHDEDCGFCMDVPWRHENDATWTLLKCSLLQRDRGKSELGKICFGSKGTGCQKTQQSLTWWSLCGT